MYIAHCECESEHESVFLSFIFTVKDYSSTKVFNL